MLRLLLASPALLGTTLQEARAPTAGAERVEPLLLRGVTVHTMIAGEEPRVCDLLLEGERIRTVESAGAGGAVPKGMRVLELAGKHVIPGLIDAHVNFDPAHDPLYLASGVTLVRDLGGDHVVLHLERAPARRNRGPGPDLLTAGAALDGDPPAASSAVVLRNPDAAEAYLPILFEEGVDFLSILPGLPREVWQKTLALAHERGRPVFGPRPSGVSLAEAIEAGQDGFHGLDCLLPAGASWDRVEPASLAEPIRALASSGKALVPLLQASAARLDDQDADTERRALLALLEPAYESWWRAELEARRPFLEPERRAAGEVAIAAQVRALRELAEAGAKLLPGSGAPQPWLLPGSALHEELARWVRAGIPLQAVLEHATRGAAELLGLAGERGTIEPGAIADLVVLDQDPRADLAHLVDPAWVVVRGRPLARTELQANLDAEAKRQAEVRAERARPVVLEPPPQGEEGIVLLEGTVESHSFGNRISTERYRVVRLEQGAHLFTGRLRLAPAAGVGERELTVEQFVRDGRLAQVHATLRAGNSLLEHDGVWTASTWRMQTRLDGRIVSTPAPLREQPVCVDASSVTALLILAQAGPAEQLPVVQLHLGFDAEPVHWRLEREPEGYRVRTQLGHKLFRLRETGAFDSGLTRLGVGTIVTHALSADAFGGAGLPVPPDRAGAGGGSTPPKPGG